MTSAQAEVLRFPAMLPVNTEAHEAARFDEAVRQAAMRTGCEVLLGLPGAMFSRQRGKAAAIVRRGREGEAEFVFFLLQPEAREIRLISGDEAPEAALRLVHSYAGVLGLLAAGRGGADRLQ